MSETNSPPGSVAYFEELDARSRDWACPGCGAIYRMGRGISVGEERCSECGHSELDRGASRATPGGA